ncbi:MAG: aquaporin [Candidatus Komeilibacteria bacterium]
MKKYIAEFIGSLFLTLVVALSLASGSAVPIPMAAGLTFGLLVYATGHISGAQINPIVTIGLWFWKKIKAKQAGLYIIAQFLGAWGAMIIIKYMKVIPATVVVVNSVPVFLAEMIGSIVFTFGVAAVVSGKVRESLGGVVIGAALMVGIILAGAVSNGTLNPAVAYGIRSFSWVYLLAPIVGSLIGMNLFRWLNKNS